MSEPIDPGVIEPAGRVFDRARAGATEEPAAHHDHPDTVAALLAAGADPDAGGPSARLTAQFFDLPAMTAQLDAARR